MKAIDLLTAYCERTGTTDAEASYLIRLLAQAAAEALVKQAKVVICEYCCRHVANVGPDLVAQVRLHALFCPEHPLRAAEAENVRLHRELVQVQRRAESLSRQLRETQNP
jgi:hypothetical protein